VVSKKKASPQIIANLIINKKIPSNISSAEFISRLENMEIKEVDMEKLKEVFKDVLEENKKAVDDYRAGKKNALMFLLGRTMAKLKNANARKIQKELEKRLSK